MSADFNPDINPLPGSQSNITVQRTSYNQTGSFRFWCQKVLPLVYDESLSYYELLCKVVNFLNEVIENVDNLHDENTNVISAFSALQTYVNTTDAAMTSYVNNSVEALQTAYSSLQDYVNNYFDNLDVTTEINNKLDLMASDGTLTNLIAPILNDKMAGYQTQLNLLDSRLTTLLENTVSGGTTLDAEVIDIRTGYDGTEYNSAGDAVREQVEAIHDFLDDSLAYEVPLFKSWFYYHKGLNSNNQDYDTNGRMLTREYFNFPYPIKIVASPTTRFWLYDTVAQERVDSDDVWKTSYVLPSLHHRIVVGRTDNVDITSSDLTGFKILTTREGVALWKHLYTYELTATSKMPEYGGANLEYGGPAVQRYGIGVDADNFGCYLDISGHTRYRCSALPFYAETPVRIVVGRSGNITCTVLTNTEAIAADKPWGSIIDIPANTLFNIVLNTSTADYSGHYESAVIIGVEGTEPNVRISQTIIQAGSNIAVQAAFMYDGKYFDITADNDNLDGKPYYDVREPGNATLIDRGVLDHSVGHANSANVQGDTAYVSDWNDPSKIHVFTIDDTNYTMAWSKDLTVPTLENQGRTDYFVFDSEQQIFGLGWKTGTSAVHPNTMVLYYIVADEQGGYHLSWTKEIKRASTLQSIFFDENTGTIYYINCNRANDNKTININAIDAATGQTYYNSYELAGTIIQREAESITYIGCGLFIVLEHLGTTFVVGFKRQLKSYI